MKVKILVAAKYADFESKPGRVKAIRLEVGEEVDFPNQYAQQIIEVGLAEEVTRSARADVVVNLNVPPETEAFREALGAAVKDALNPPEEKPKGRKRTRG